MGLVKKFTTDINELQIILIILEILDTIYKENKPQITKWQEISLTLHIMTLSKNGLNYLPKRKIIRMAKNVLPSYKLSTKISF